MARGTVVLTPAPPQPLPGDLLAAVGVLVPNEHELRQLAGVEAGDRSPGELAGLARAVTSGTVVVTLGARGALLVPAEDGDVLLQPPPPVDPVDTTGAGDCFSGALGQALATGRGLGEAVRWAVTAAALSTTGPGARGALPAAAEVDAALARTPAPEPVGVRPSGDRAQVAGPTEEAAAMTESQRTPHPEDPAEGQEAGEADGSGRTPHPDQPAEGPDTGGGADTPG